MVEPSDRYYAAFLDSVSTSRFTKSITSNKRVVSTKIWDVTDLVDLLIESESKKAA